MVVHVIGVGAEGRSSLTNRAQEVIDRAELLVGGGRLLAMFPESMAERVTLASDPITTINGLRDLLGKRRIAVLASGDPGFFGIARLMAEQLGRENVEILPNVCSMQLAFARIKESWDDATFLSVHGREMKGLAEKVRQARKIAILTDHVNTPAAVAQYLLSAGAQDCRAYLCEELGGPREKVQQTSLSAVSRMEAASLSILVLINEERNHTEVSAVWPHGIPEDEFSHRRGMITKAEVRLATLARLRLRESSVVWDIGAGCGSVAIEAAMIARLGHVYAIERNYENIEMIQANLAKFNVRNLTPIHGEAPSALESLPAPGAVFIGGSGGKLHAVLDVVDRRLTSEGRVVINAASLETAGTALADLRVMGYEVDATLMQVSRGKDLAGLTHFEALDPVFIVAGRKPARSNS